MSKPVLRTLTCPSCSAPVPPPMPGATQLQCVYCRSTIMIEAPKVPVIQPTAPPPNLVRATSAARRPLAAVIVGMAFAIVAAMVAFSSFHMRRASRGVAFDDKEIVSFPAACFANRSMTITGKTFEGTGTLVTIHPNCKLTHQGLHPEG